jgi:copper(I)-binding protein
MMKICLPRLSAFDSRLSAIRSAALAPLLVAYALAAQAEVTVKDAWVRGTVAGQRSSGAFLAMTSTEEAKIVAVSSPVAKVAEIHATKNDRGMMVMEHVPTLALPAGKTVEFKPGGHHVMLMGIEKPLAKGATVPITFTVEDAKGRRSSVEVKAAVRPLGQ